MPDEIDQVQELALIENDAAVFEIRRRAELPPGTPGYCGECTQKSRRLVHGRCAPCRDGR